MSEPQTAVENLISEIETIAAKHDLYLHRFQTNGSNHRTTITYALHDSADKPTTGKLCVGYCDAVVLGQAEGSTKRCEAYRELSKLLETVKSL